ncbi:MAG TPA: homoserine kinase [Dermatophilaceae bacterium]|nr:homoserine kinase [Dermatophilaceae bacterium]
MAVSAPAVGTSVEVRVPASSANLGPGFDSLGLALGVWDTCRVTVSPGPGVTVTVRGEGAGSVPLDESHLVLRAMRRAWVELGVPPPPGLDLDCENAVPHGRGMGSSATAIVTGIVAAQALAGGEDVDLGFANDLASRLEGHPDNASASVFGGATLSWSDDPQRGTTTVRLPVHPDVVPVVFAPSAQLSTARARSVLPASVRLADAAANSARAAVLVHALGQAPEHLLAGTREWLHQEPRRSSYPASMDLVDRLRGDGHAAVISGAGPSVLVLATSRTVDVVCAGAPAGWRVLTPDIPERGASARVLTARRG